MKLSQTILMLLVVFVAGSVATVGIGWGTNLIAFPKRVEAAVPKTFPQMVTEASAQVPALSPAEASAALKANPDTLVIDVRDAADIAATGIIPGAANISLGTLTFKADNQVPLEWRDVNLANRARPIITTCYSGEMGALAGKLLTDMGFTNVRTLKGGTVAWKAAGLPTNPLKVEAAPPKTFPDMVTAALAQVPAISPAEASAALKANPDTLVIDVRDAADIAATGMIPGAVNISLGTLTFKADNQVPPEWRDVNLANRARPIITTCYSGEMGALAGKLLTDMGFTNVRSLKGGTVAWKDAGLPTK